MRIVLAGPGAIGCAVTLRLVQSGHEVTLLDRHKDRAERLSRRGLFLESGGSNENVAIHAVDTAPNEPFPLVLLCVKAYSTEDAILRVRPCIGADTVVVSLQNGIGNAERVIRASGVSPRKVVCATTTMGGTLLADGHVRLTGAGHISVAPHDPSGGPSADRAIEALEQAGFTIRHRPSARDMIWSKAVVNAAINPITAIENIPNGTILERADLRELMRDAANEAGQVAAAADIRLVYADAAMQAERVCQGTRDNLSSMLQDVRHGRRTEIDAINGAIVAEAQKHGVRSPINRHLHNAVRDLESHSRTPGRRNRADFA